MPSQQGRCPRTKRAILSIDGGGLKGVMAACVLEVLEEELRRESGIDDLLLAEAFDIIVGTSTGSILASHLSLGANPTLREKLQADFEARSGKTGKDIKTTQLTPDGTVAKSIELYRTFAPDVFPQNQKRSMLGTFICGAKYPVERAETALMNVYESVHLDDLANADSGELKLASTMLTTYDMVNGEQAFFVADRELKTGRYMRLDPFSIPNGANGSTTTIRDDRSQILEQRLAAMDDGIFGPDSAMTLFNLGDARVEQDELEPGQVRLSGNTIKENWRGDEHVLLWQAVRCSTAAPTFFKPARVQDFWTLRKRDGSVEKRDLVAADGALAANNPVLSALIYQATLDARLRSNRFQGSKHMLEDYAVLSIGCGAMFGLNSAEKMAKQDSVLDWVTGPSSLVDIMFNNSQSAHHAIVEGLFAAIAAKHKDPSLIQQYMRIQVSVDQRAKPGEAGYAAPSVIKALSAMDDPSQFEELMRIGKGLAELYRPLLVRFIQNYLVAKKSVRMSRAL